MYGEEPVCALEQLDAVETRAAKHVAAAAQIVERVAEHDRVHAVRDRRRDALDRRIAAVAPPPHRVVGARALAVKAHEVGAGLHWPSASTNAAVAWRAAARPACIACDLPRAGNASTSTRVSPIARARAAVSSREPSSTITIW